jgi:hypothetical protein
MAKKPKKPDQSATRRDKSRRPADDQKSSVVVHPLTVRKVAARHYVLTFPPTTLKALDPPEPAPKNRRRGRK